MLGAMSALPTRFSAELPAWVVSEVEDAGPLVDDDARMALCHRLAARNPAEGCGGPFAALVVDSATGAVVSAGVNLVLASGLSVTHAEVVALSLAQVAVGGWDLGGDGAPSRELVVNWRPCTQCYGALLWAGVRRLVIGGQGADVERLTGFDEGPVPDGWTDELRARGVEVVVDVQRERAIEIFTEYGHAARRGERVVYNGRGGGAATP